MSRLGDLSPADVPGMTVQELARRVKMTDRALNLFSELQKDFDAHKLVERLRSKEADFVTPVDENYPERLRRIPDPPPALFLKGVIPPAPAVALVGSRKASPTGLDAARQVGKALSERGVCVVSGLALGIDAAAHEGALSGSGPTVGVLGCGIDVVYPRSNRSLHQRVKNSGGVVSEYCLGEAPLPWRFPARNRIIAGLADVLVVVEAPEKSGALITARHALESGRDVWAVPGPTSVAECRGSNKLLADGAGVLWDIPAFAEEIIPATLTAQPKSRRDSIQQATVPAELPKEEARVLASIGFEPTPVDSLADRSGVDMLELLSAVALLELKGYVTRDPTGSLLRSPIT